MTDWYPGNGASATQQVLGPREMPSKWSGEWRRTMMVRAPSTYGSAQQSDASVATPATLRDFPGLPVLFGGALLRVTWTVDKQEIAPNGSTQQYQFATTRVGRATSWKFPHDDIDDIHWEITFDWSGRGGAQQVAAATRDDDVATLGNPVVSSISDVMTLTSSTSPFFSTSVGLSGSAGGSFGFGVQAGGSGFSAGISFGATTTTLGQLETVSPALVAIVQAFDLQLAAVQVRYQQASQVASALQTTPISNLQNVVAMSTTTILACNTFRDAINTIPAELIVQAGASFADQLRAQRFVADLYFAALRCARASPSTPG